MAKLPELGYEGLGELTHILHDQGVSDLSWLAVNEEDYRAHEALPQQNLDVIPEFQKALSQEGDGRVPSLIPLRPHTIVNSNPLDHQYGKPSSNYNLVPGRVAKFVMAGLSPKAAADKLQLEFSPSDLRLASSEVQEILKERGVLGTVYIDSKYLPRCNQDSSDKKFANTVTKKALFVLASGKCTGCSCNNQGFCSSLKRRLVSEVPYGPKLAALLNNKLSSENRSIEISDSEISKDEWKSRIQVAFSKTPITKRHDSVQTIQTQHAPKKLVVNANDVQRFITRQEADSGVDKMPSAKYLKYAHQVMLGRDAASLAGSGDPEIQSLMHEVGILGHTYLDMDALGGCRNTQAFMERAEASGAPLSPDFILRRSASCSLCRGTSDGACAYLCTKTEILTRKPDITKQSFVQALQRATLEKRISSEQARIAHSKFGSLKDIRLAVAFVNTVRPEISEEPARYSGASVVAFNGDPGRGLAPEPMNAEEVRRSVSHLMNMGLFGRHLQASVLTRYSTQDLSQVPEVGQELASYDGIQGDYFLDPTAYSDYGKGCSIGARQFKDKKIPFIMASSACTGCALQTAPGWCSKYARGLIRQVPQEARAAARKRFLPIIKTAPIENPIEKYELASEFVFEPKIQKSKLIEISIDGSQLTE